MGGLRLNGAATSKRLLLTVMRKNWPKVSAEACRSQSPKVQSQSQSIFFCDRRFDIFFYKTDSFCCVQVFLGPVDIEVPDAIENIHSSHMGLVFSSTFLVL